MSNILAGFLGALLATNTPAALSNVLEQTTGLTVKMPASTNALEQEFRALMEADDQAQEEVDKWILENQEFAAKGAGLPRLEMKRKIEARLEPVRKGYETFLEKHPDYTRARVAYASFLSETKDEDSAMEQLEKALTMDTNSPAVYNNLANIYGHIGPDVKKAFEYYQRAIDLNPNEPVYYQNYATTVYLFRKDAREYFNITEPEVFAKSFQLYSNAVRLDPQNFELRSSVAQGYYGWKPIRTEEALKAWTNALEVATDDKDREGVYLHFARIKMMAGRFAEAHAHLQAVTNPAWTDLKRRLEKNLADAERGTNAPATGTPAQPATAEKEPKPGS